MGNVGGGYLDLAMALGGCPGLSLAGGRLSESAADVETMPDLEVTAPTVVGTNARTPSHAARAAEQQSLVRRRGTYDLDLACRARE